jgi:gas vesicle protein
MISPQRRIDDDPWLAARQVRQGSGAASLLLATLLGFGIGVLAAPQPGSKTRKLLRKRLAALGEEMGEGLEEVQEVSSKARKRARERLAKLREEAGEWEGVGERWQRVKSRIRDAEPEESDESSPLGALVALAAGAAATYLLTSDRAAPVRSRVQVAASDVRRRATDQWDRFQRGGFRSAREGGSAQQSQPEPQAGTTPIDETQSN